MTDEQALELNEMAARNILKAIGYAEDILKNTLISGSIDIKLKVAELYLEERRHIFKEYDRLKESNGTN
jgi:hypothetical protein